MADLNIVLFNTGFEQKKDEAALCQLGAAAAILWEELPANLQDKLLDIAERVTGVPFTPVA